jgi:hypothetical protein
MSAVNCQHWRECSVRGGGCCAAGVYDRPSIGVCASVCQRRVSIPGYAPEDPQARSVAATRRTPCVHLGLLVDAVRCQSCNGTVYIKLFHCGLHEKCSIERQVNGSAVCKTCPDYIAK